MKEGITLVLIGPPGSGKTRLINSLLYPLIKGGVVKIVSYQRLKLPQKRAEVEWEK